MEGSKGNEMIATGALKMAFRPTSYPWEYRRGIIAVAVTTEMKKAGWTYVSSWLPFHYFKGPMSAE
ncbi:hypothetical protein C8J45_1136 [Sphingomonas sp. PP-CE-3G-477]|nr:hypothetical protein C8J45_1136 [Sphingomonas sp. PP-CE-3G-477]